MGRCAKGPDLIDVHSHIQLCEAEASLRCGRDCSSCAWDVKTTEKAVFVHGLQIIPHLDLLMIAVVTGVRWYLIVGEGAEKREPFCTVGGNEDWCSPCGKEYGIS